MLSSRDFRIAECPRPGKLQPAPLHPGRCGAIGSRCSQGSRSAQQPGQAVQSVSVLHQQTAVRHHACTQDCAGQHFAEASITQQSSENKASGQCLANAVMDSQASTSTGAGAAVPTEQGQSRGTRKVSSYPHFSGSVVQSKASKGVQEPSTQPALWCWEWANTRWRASFFFLQASVAFVLGSGASLQPHIFAGRLQSIHI